MSLEYDSIIEDALIAADRETNLVPLNTVYELIKRAYKLGRQQGLEAAASVLDGLVQKCVRNAAENPSIRELAIGKSFEHQLTASDIRALKG